MSIWGLRMFSWTVKYTQIVIGSHNDVMLKRPLRGRFSQRPFQHMDISNEPVIRHFH